MPAKEAGLLRFQYGQEDGCRGCAGAGGGCHVAKARRPLAKHPVCQDRQCFKNTPSGKRADAGKDDGGPHMMTVQRIAPAIQQFTQIAVANR